MPFYRSFYHLVWATQNRAPLIDSEREKVLYAFLDQKCQELKCELLAVNGTADHVHLALMIPPAQAAADIAKQLKGASSREINQQFDDDERFRWQSGYGLFTIGEKALPELVAYIVNQKERHSTGKIHSYYEQTGDD